jgi:hypothetical protein
LAKPIVPSTSPFSSRSNVPLMATGISAPSFATNVVSTLSTMSRPPCSALSIACLTRFASSTLGYKAPTKSPSSSSGE